MQANLHAQDTRFTNTLILGDSLSSGGENDWVAYAPGWYYDPALNKSVAGQSIGDLRAEGGLNEGIAALVDEWLTTHTSANAVILFAGVNDISSSNGHTGEQLFADFQATIATIKRHSGVKNVVVLPPIPFGSTPGRFGYERAKKYMALVEAESASDPLLHYFDAWTYMEDPGRPGYQKAGYTNGLDHTHTIAAGAIALEAGITAFIESNLVKPSVDIDIQPWDAANKTYPTSDRKIIVAINSTNIAAGDSLEFDATQVDPVTLKLGIGEAPNIAATPLVIDKDRDSDSDVMFVFRTQDTGIFCGDTEATLTGRTYAGQLFTGTDSVTTVDCVDDCHS